MKRRTAWLLVVVAYVFGIVTPFAGNWFLTSFFHSDAEYDEMSRSTSPDGVLDAVTVQVNPGAMSSYIYCVYLVPHGTSASDLRREDPIFRSVHGRPTVAWQSNHFLSVDPGASHITSFANLWYSKKLPNYYVELSWHPAPIDTI